MCLCELANLLTRRDPTSALFFLKQVRTPTLLFRSPQLTLA